MPGHIQSIQRAAAILRLLSGRTRRLGVVDLAGELELAKGTVHGLLRTLQSVGFVEQDADSGKYQLGAALLHMGSSYLDGNELRTRALNWSDSLAARTQEAVRIGTLHDSQVLIVHHVFRPDDTSSDPRCRLAAAGARDGVGQGADRSPSLRRRRAQRQRTRGVHPADDHRSREARLESARACATRGGAPRSASCPPARCRLPLRSWIGRAPPSAPSRSLDLPSDCSTPVSRGVISCGTCAMQPALCHMSSGRSPGEDTSVEARVLLVTVSPRR